MEENRMKAILVWSDRTNMKYSLFDDKIENEK